MNEERVISERMDVESLTDKPHPLYKRVLNAIILKKSIFHANGTIKWASIHAFTEPRRTYTHSNTHHHKDCLGRVWTGHDDDRYLSATDGRLAKLIVQATGEICERPNDATWARTKIRNTTPFMLKVMFWVMGERLERGDKASTVKMVVRWVPACLGIFFLLWIPADLGGEVRNKGRYEQFKYHYWGYSIIPSNPLEAASGTSLISQSQETNPISERPLRPRYLCFIEETGISIRKVSEWEDEHGAEASLQYLFISYTTEQFSHASEDDMDELHRIAEGAARNAGVHAYWISCSCMPDEELSEDVYRISDVVRGARSLIIIVGSPTESETDIRTLLRHWGRRMWTFPEVLLSPSTLIAVYTRNSDINHPRLIPKRSFPIEAWHDAPVSRQLVDHYDASIILSPLELVTIALQCLGTRETTSYHAGDMSYALMGLLRRRPKVNANNTAFQAFCRLSLANDSNRLLERLICLLPQTISQPWHVIDDFWSRNLWDIDPHCQVVGVGEGDTVILSGAFGAPIRWKSFAPVNLLLRNTVRRWVAKVGLRGVPLWLIMGIFFLATSKSKGGTFAVFTAFGWMAMFAAISAIFLSPKLLCALYVGKTWMAQPWLFGFEGYLEISEIEKAIFGINLNRLKWSPYSSDLSRHRSINGECIGVDPISDPDIRRLIADNQDSTYGAARLFTLVDTNTLTVTLFRAVRPPVALLLCGSEGGMQRALLCSYDWTTQTLYRESVMRMDTLALERMSRVDRFRLGMKRGLGETVLCDSV